MSLSFTNCIGTLCSKREAEIEFQCPESDTGEEPFSEPQTPMLSLNASGMPKVDRLMPSSHSLAE